MPEPAMNRKVEPRPAAAQPEAAGTPANSTQGFTAEDEAFFAQGEARTRAAEAEMKRRAEQAAYDERERKIKELKGQM